MMQFFLRTTDVLVKDPGNEVDEHNLIEAWTNHTGHAEKHIHLQEINLWYGYGREISFQSSWSRWFNRRKGTWYWRRISHKPTKNGLIEEFWGYF